MKQRLFRFTLLSFSLFHFSLYSEIFIFDLFGVLIDIPLVEKIKHVGIINPLGYIFSEKKDITQLKNNFFNMLSKIPVNQELLSSCSYSPEITAQGEPMPAIMVLWQAGKINYKDALAKIYAHLINGDYGYYERELFIDMSKVAFDLKTRQNCYKIMEEGLEIAQRLSREKDVYGFKKHRLFILSNMDREMIRHLENTYTDLYSIFEDVIYSAENSLLKPDQNIYLSLIKKYNLNTSECWMIDDQKENIDAAINLGMKGIICQSHSDVVDLLEKKGFLSAKTNILDSYLNFKDWDFLASEYSVYQ
jgi:HAD superfamily hydrolase (TIGR01549 family)